MFKKTLLAGAVAAAILPLSATAADAPASPHTFTGNVGLYSQYIFRGMTQTNGDPAIQGGFDYSHASGFYAGTWASNISWLKENNSVAGPPPFISGTYGGGGSMEWDFYGGYKWSLPNDFTLDVGTLYYWYPGDINPAYQAAVSPIGVPKGDTWEVYAGLSWKWLSAKLSYSVDNKTFAVLDSSGTYYLDLAAAYPIPDTKITLIAHYGIQKFTGTDLRNYVGLNGVRLDNDDTYSYKDWKLGLTYALPKDFTIGAYVTGTSGVNKLGWGSYSHVVPGVGAGVYPKDMAKTTGTIYIQKTF